MTSVRLPESSELQVHNVDNIIAKLNSNLTDAERRSFLGILMASEKTVAILVFAIFEWQNRLLNQKNDIEILKEKIRINNCSIDAINNLDTTLSQKDINRIHVAQTKIDEDNSTLTRVQAKYDESSLYATKSLDIIGPMARDLLPQYEENINQRRVSL